MTETRPPLVADIPGGELTRWYWLRSELADFARSLGVPAAGGKQELTARLIAHLDRCEASSSDPSPPVTRPYRRAAVLTEPLTAETVLPAGQRCTQQLRRYFIQTIGPSFRFDGAMRDFIADGPGRTLGEAVDHWHATRSSPPAEIGAQFELNRFLREWHRANPTGSHSAALDAWRAHRALPVDARAVIG